MAVELTSPDISGASLPQERDAPEVALARKIVDTLRNTKPMNPHHLQIGCHTPYADAMMGDRKIRTAVAKQVRKAFPGKMLEFEWWVNVEKRTIDVDIKSVNTSKMIVVSKKEK